MRWRGRVEMRLCVVGGGWWDCCPVRDEFMEGRMSRMLTTGTVSTFSSCVVCFMAKSALRWHQ